MQSFLRTLGRLVPGLGLIFAAAVVLLLSDRQSRRPANAPALPVSPAAVTRIAFLQHSSSQVMDETREGFVAGLAARGWAEGSRITLDVFNAQGDLPTGSTMASRLSAGDYRLVATASTTMLQAFANANRAGRTTHVFMGVSAPVEAGVGVFKMDSTEKPAWMAGIGSAQPVEAIFREAKRLWPSLSTVGVVWNPAEVNSRVCTERARAVSSELGMTLLESSIDSAQGVREGVDALIARGAEAIWTGGDASVVPAIDALTAVAAKAGIPVFSNMAGQVLHGSTFDLGADYREVGREAARIAANILEGADPAGIPVRNFMPERLFLSEKAARALRRPYVFDEATRARADAIVDAAGELKPTARAMAAASVSKAASALVLVAGTRPEKISLVMYLETLTMEEGLAGFRDGLKASGLLEGRDYELQVQSAQGDIAILSGIIDNINSGEADLVVAYSTPALQSALRKIKTKPLVFGIVADPFAAGAGTDDGKHLPNVTGVYIPGAFAEMAALLKKHFPHW